MQHMSFPADLPPAKPSHSGKPQAELVRHASGKDFGETLAERALPSDAAPADDFLFAPSTHLSIPLDAPITLPRSGDEFQFGALPESRLAEALGVGSAPVPDVTTEPENEIETPELDDRLRRLQDQIDQFEQTETADTPKIAPINEAVEIETPDPSEPSAATDRAIPMQVPVFTTRNSTHAIEMQEDAHIDNIFVGDSDPDDEIFPAALGKRASDRMTGAGTLKAAAAADISIRQTSDMQPALSNAQEVALQAEPSSTDAPDLVQSRSAVSETISRAAPPPPAIQQMVANQIAVAVSQTSSRDFEIRLDPEELGKLRIVLSARDGGYDVMIIAEREQTLELIKRNAAGLAGQFEQMGYGGSTLNFAAEQNMPGEDRDARDLDDIETTLMPIFPTSPGIPMDGLDIRY